MTQVPAPNHRLIAARALAAGNGRSRVSGAVIIFAALAAILLEVYNPPVTHWQILIGLVLIVVMAVSNMAADHVIRILAEGFLRETIDAAWAAARDQHGELAMRQLGLGGTGWDPAVPECPLCYAYGGGGHGGLCPNARRPPADWVTVLPAGYTGPAPRSSRPRGNGGTG